MILSKHSGTVYRTRQLFSLGSARAKYPWIYVSKSFSLSINLSIYYDPSIALILTLSIGSFRSASHNYNNCYGWHYILARSDNTPAQTLLTIGVSSPHNYLNKSQRIFYFSNETCL